MAHFFTSHNLEYMLKQLNSFNASSLIILIHSSVTIQKAMLHGVWDVGSGGEGTCLSELVGR